MHIQRVGKRIFNQRGEWRNQYSSETYLLLSLLIPDKEKELKFYFRISLWSLKGFMKAFKTFRSNTKKCESKNLS